MKLILLLLLAPAAFAQDQTAPGQTNTGQYRGNNQNNNGGVSMEPTNEDNSRPAPEDAENPSEGGQGDPNETPPDTPGKPEMGGKSDPPGEVPHKLVPRAGEPGYNPNLERRDKRAVGEESEEVEEVSPDELREDLAGTVEGMVEAQATKGIFSFKDAVTKKDYKVTFNGIVAKKIELIGGGARAVIPTAFKTADGLHTLVADFFLKKSEEGGFEQEKIQVRVIDGRTKFAYDKDYKMVAPAKAPAKKAKPAKKKAKRAR